MVDYADDTVALDSHGTLWSVQFTPGGSFTPVAQLGDITPPDLSRAEFKANVHGKKMDQYVLSKLLSRSAMTVPLNWLSTDTTHSAEAGLMKLLIDNTLTGHKITWPDADEYIMSGQIQNIKHKAPVEGKREADVTIRFSGAMKISGVLVG